jgi:hypothetical protein
LALSKRHRAAISSIDLAARLTSKSRDRRFVDEPTSLKAVGDIFERDAPRESASEEPACNSTHLDRRKRRVIMGELRMDKRNLFRQTLRAPYRRLRLVTCALMTTLATFTGTALGASVTIDNFTQPNPYAYFHVSSGNNTSEEMSETASGVIGGQRDLLVNVVGQAQPNSAVGIVGFDTSYALDAIQVGTNGLSPTIATLQYSGPDAKNTSTSLVNAHDLGGGAGIDLTGGGTNSRFLLTFMGVDAQPTAGLDLVITITSPGGKTSKVSATVPNSLATFNFYVPFSGLMGNASTTHVDSILVSFNSVRQTPNVDYAVQFIGTVASAPVPEPASASLMAAALGALGLIAVRRRRLARALKARHAIG